MEVQLTLLVGNNPSWCWIYCIAVSGWNYTKQAHQGYKEKTTWLINISLYLFFPFLKIRSRFSAASACVLSNTKVIICVSIYSMLTFQNLVYWRTRGRKKIYFAAFSVKGLKSIRDERKVVWKDLQAHARTDTCACMHAHAQQILSAKPWRLKEMQK